jgi:hypothetical protein
MKNNDSFIVELQGGLGNQLFGLAFAQYLSQKQKRKFILSERQIDKGITKHGVKISDFDIQATFLNDPSTSPKIDRFKTALERRFPPLKGLNQVSYNSKAVGYDFIAERTYRNRYRGYFQSYIYAAELRGKIPGGLLSVRESTPWLVEYIKNAVAAKPIMMHIRRGDYFKVQSEFGILSEDYYKNALSILRNAGSTSPVWVFTDSPDLINQEFIDKLDCDSRIVIPPSESTPIESLSLMQYGSANIISNSTFSWWPAFLSKSSTQTICPSKWFINMETPQKLLPENWTQINPVWL